MVSNRQAPSSPPPSLDERANELSEAELIRVLREDRDTSVGPGAVVASLKRGHQTIKVGGLADLEGALPIDADTKFHVASVAKQFTAFLVALLVAERKVDIDQPVGEILDWLRPPTSSCTVRQLLYHTSGIRDHWSLSEFAGLRDGDSITTEDVCGWIASQKALNFAAGSRFLYSNSGYALLARVVERADHDNFPRVAKRRIFDPLGMTNSFFVDDPAAVISGKASGYRPNAGGYERCDPNYGVVGATCLRTTANDMMAWLSRSVDDTFFSLAADVGYFEPGSLDDGTPIRYGFGQIHTTLRGRRVILHGGFDYGFNAITLRDPLTNDALFAASNGSTKAVEGTAMSFFASWADAQPSTSDHIKAPSSESSIRLGTYARDDMTDVRTLHKVDGQCKLFWNQDFDLNRIAGGVFEVVGTTVTLQPLENAICLNSGSDEIILTRIVDAPFQPSELDGLYVSDALGSLLRIETIEGLTSVRIGRGESVLLVSVNPDLLTFGANWMTVERERSRVVRLRLSQARCVGVEFRPLEY